MKKVIGIAGFIGTGKTVAGQYFQSLGADFIEADDVVNDLYKEGEEGYRKIVQYFGGQFVGKDGSLDRKKIARYVYGDIHKLNILNHLIHPLVTNEIQKRIDASSSDIIFVEAVYFRQKELGRLVNEILWIDCDPKIIRDRVLKRPEINEKLLENILKIQEKPEEIDIVVENNKDIPSFQKDLKKIWDSYQ